jgi:hypothetical protein
VASARIMGPIQISAGANPAMFPGANPAMFSGEARMPFQNPMGQMGTMGQMHRMVCLTCFYFHRRLTLFFYLGI